MLAQVVSFFFGKTSRKEKNMLTVFQTETGGSLSFACGAQAVSGYADVVTRDRRMYRFDGYVTSGYLHIPKNALATTLPPVRYTCLPQTIDASSKVFFLEPNDLEIISIPDFFNSVVVVSGSSILTRLTTLEGLVVALAGAPSDALAHSSLLNLTGDDHPQYLTLSRGDDRYGRFAVENTWTSAQHINTVDSSLNLSSTSNSAIVARSNANAVVRGIRTTGTQAANTVLDWSVEVPFNGSPSTAFGFRERVGLSTINGQLRPVRDASFDDVVLTNTANSSYGARRILTLPFLSTMYERLIIGYDQKAANLTIPFQTGGVLPALYVGGAASTQIAIDAETSSNTAIRATSTTAAALIAQVSNTYTGAVDVRAAVASNIAIATLVRKRVDFAGAAAIGFGARDETRLRTSSSSDVIAANEDVVWRVAANNMQTSEKVVSLALAGSIVEVLRVSPVLTKVTSPVQITGRLALRSADLTQTAGLFVPWISGDTLPTLSVGSTAAGMNQIAIRAFSDTGIGIIGGSYGGVAGVHGYSWGSAPGVVAENAGAGNAFALRTLVRQHGTVGPTNALRQMLYDGPATGNGLRNTIVLPSSTTAERDAAYDDTVWADPIDATRAAERRISLVYQGAMHEALRIAATKTTFWNRLAKAIGTDRGVVLEDIASDGRMKLYHSTGVGQIEFWHGGSNLKIVNAIIETSLIGTGPLGASNNGSNDVRLQLQKSGNGTNQTLYFWAQQYAPAPANNTPPKLLVAASSIGLATHVSNGDNAMVDGSTTEQARVEATAAAEETPLLLRHNGTLKRVKVGAMDSGGTGQRLLTIDN